MTSDKPSDTPKDDNPFASPAPLDERGEKGWSPAAENQSVFDEPHLLVQMGISKLDSFASSDVSHEGHVARMGIWEEPQFAESTQVTGGQPRPGSYGAWLAGKIAATTWPKSLVITLAIVVFTGPTAVLMALLGVVDEKFARIGILHAVIFGPVMEEIAKVVIALMVIELWPYCFKHSVQIMLTALAGGLAFAVIENLIYLNLYINNPTDEITLWRWVICTTLHVACSGIAGLGLVRIWRRCVRTLKEPNYLLALPFLIVAAALHGAYNATVTILEATGYLF